MEINKIYRGDCAQIINEKIDKNSVHLIFADPPYNLSGKSLNLANNTTGGPFFKMNEKWDTMTEKEYIFFTEKWIQGAKKVLVNNGSLYISCTQHNISEIILACKVLGFKLNNILTWYKTNAMPSITKRTFTHSTEYVCWFVKGKNWVFNYSDVKKFNPQKTKDGNPKQMRDFLDFIEIPIVQGKERLKDKNGRALHPTQKPEKLIELVILASSRENDLVLDPFMGSGTTAIVAERLNRNWIGIEKNDDYVRATNKRILDFRNHVNR